MRLPVPLQSTLTPKMLAFVEAYIEAGGRNAGRCAILAGYSPTSAGPIASRLLRRPDVLAYLRHVAESRMQADVIASAEVLRTLRDDPTVAAAERRKCASELLDRAGLIVAKHVINEHVMPSAEELRDRLAIALRTLGLDASAVPLIEVVEDVDYEEVEEHEPEPGEPETVEPLGREAGRVVETDPTAGEEEW